MRVCLLGDAFGNLDEGMKNTAFYLYRELSKHHDVLLVKPRRALFPSTARKVRDFRPAIIHYVHGPSLRSLLVARWLSRWTDGARTVVSAMHPNLSQLGKRLVPLLKPDLVLVQSTKTRRFFESLGCDAMLVPSGVDLERFRPVSCTRKAELRHKYGLGEEAFVVLHVGPIRKSRNIVVLVELQRETNAHFVIAGSTTVSPDAQLVKELREAGCTVWLHYFSQVEHLFQLADCYIFPVLDEEGSVQFPLTVLEAAACNLPIVTTPFGGLPAFLPEGRGLHYANDEEAMAEALAKCMEAQFVETRSLAEGFSWQTVAQVVLKNCYALVHNDEHDKHNATL